MYLAGLLLLVAGGACREAAYLPNGECPTGKPPANAAAQFRGYVRLGPEQVSFQPCGATWTHRWWLTGGGAGWELAQCILDSQPLCDLGTMPCELQEAYVEMDADLSAPGSFGHMGAYEKAIRATRVLYAARRPRGECAQPEGE
jgi:hypothetical protein